MMFLTWNRIATKTNTTEAAGIRPGNDRCRTHATHILACQFALGGPYSVLAQRNDGHDDEQLL
jgi:hypothetical protein